MIKSSTVKLVITSLITIVTFALVNVPVFASLTTPTVQEINDEQLFEDFEAKFSEISAKMALTSPQERDLVQVFDVKEGHVIKSVANSSKIQKQVKRVLKDIYEFAPEVQPDMSAKYILRLPVKPGTEIKLNNRQIAINELFVFYYVNKEPLVLVFDANKRPYLFHSKHSVEPLLKLIGVE